MNLDKEIKLSVLQPYETYEGLLIDFFGASRREIRSLYQIKNI